MWHNLGQVTGLPDSRFHVLMAFSRPSTKHLSFGDVLTPYNHLSICSCHIIFTLLWIADPKQCDCDNSISFILVSNSNWLLSSHWMILFIKMNQPFWRKPPRKLGQCNGYWCPGSLRFQIIDNNCIAYIYFPKQCYCLLIYKCIARNNIYYFA